MKIIVFGGQGFIGYNLCKKLLLEGDEVVSLDKDLQSNRMINNVKYIKVDFTNKDSYVNYLNNIDVLYHLVSTNNANSSADDIKDDIVNNVIGTIDLLNACVEKKVKKIVFISSGGTIYGNIDELPINESQLPNPICSYGITKLMIEKYISLYSHLYNLNYVILRLSNIYGPYHHSLNQGLINVCLLKAISGKTIEIFGNGEIKRDYLYIDDAIEALNIVKKKEINNSIYNIGSGKGYSINQIIKVIETIVGSIINIKHSSARKQDVLVNVLDVSLAKKELNWDPKTDLKDGIMKTYNYELNDVNNDCIIGG